MFFSFFFFTSYSLKEAQRRKLPEKPREPLLNPTHFQLYLRPRGRPSPPGEGDRDQRWSDLGRVAFSLPSFLFFCSLSLILAPRPDGSEPPPPPSLFFCSIPQSPDLVLHEGDLMESLGGSSLQQISSLLLARFDLSGGRRDLLRRWMLDGQRVWRFISASVSFNHPTLRVDFSKLFLKSPYHTRIEWQIRFDFYVVYLAGIKDLNLLQVWTLAAGVVLAICWSSVKLSAVCCCFCCCCDVVVLVVVVGGGGGVFFIFLFCTSALCVGFLAVTNVTLSALYVGFCIPLCRVLYPSRRVV
jgi:hypothetical protein